MRVWRVAAAFGAVAAVVISIVPIVSLWSAFDEQRDSWISLGEGDTTKEQHEIFMVDMHPEVCSL